MDHVKRIELVLSACLEEGLLEFATETHVKFAHDQIHEAILMSIPPETKPYLHLRIGKYLLGTELDAAPVTETSYFLAVDQSSRSHEIICDVEDVADLCRVNLVAGKLAGCQMCVCARGGVSSSGRKPRHQRLTYGVIITISPLMCSHCQLSTKATLVDWNAATRWSMWLSRKQPSWKINCVPTM
jgi:hypothetical protein